MSSTEPRINYRMAQLRGVSKSFNARLDSRLDGEQLVGEALLHLLLDDLEAGLLEHLEPLAVGPERGGQ